MLDFGAARENVEAELGEREDELIEFEADGSGGALGVEAGACADGGDQRADGLLDFFFREARGEFAEGADGVELGEENVDGQGDAENLRELAEALIESLCEGANLLSGAGREDALHADAEDDGARGNFFAAGESGAKLRRDCGFDEALPEAGLLEQRAARFDECGVAGEPDIGQRGGYDAAILIDIAGEKFGIESGLEDGLGLGGVFVAHDVEERQCGQRLGSAAICFADLGVGVAKERGEIGCIGGIRVGRDGGSARPQIPDDEADDGRAEQAENGAEENQLGACEVQRKGEPDHECDIDNEGKNAEQKANHESLRESTNDGGGCRGYRLSEKENVSGVGKHSKDNNQDGSDF